MEVEGDLITLECRTIEAILENFTLSIVKSWGEPEKADSFPLSFSL